MAEVFGAKWIIAVSLIGSGLINIATPFLASSVGLLIASRVALGVVQGGVFPSGFQMIGKWIPSNERSTAFGLFYISTSVGTILGSALTGYLCDNGFAGVVGWPSAFFVSG